MTMMTIGELINQLERIKDCIRSVQAKYQPSHPNWESPIDARGAFFTGSKKAILMTQSDLEHLADEVSKEEYWKRMAGASFKESDVPEITKEYEISRRWLLMHLIYMQLEEALRRVCEAVDPAFMSQRRSLATLTDRLLKVLQLSQYQALFRLGRTMRNTIHNNGRFWPDPDNQGKRKDETIQWKGQTYHFVVGQPAPTGSWLFLFEHICDLVQAMGDVVLHPIVAGMPAIARIPVSWLSSVPLSGLVVLVFCISLLAHSL